MYCPVPSPDPWQVRDGWILGGCSIEQPPTDCGGGGSGLNLDDFISECRDETSSADRRQRSREDRGSDRRRRDGSRDRSRDRSSDRSRDRSRDLGPDRRRVLGYDRSCGLSRVRSGSDGVILTKGG